MVSAVFFWLSLISFLIFVFYYLISISSDVNKTIEQNESITLLLKEIIENQSNEK